ncbi:SKA3 protein, partial [Brachypteracias leptosomus]|nr:SKA3 protein [Brachypteracias leptosomus]
DYEDESPIRVLQDLHCEIRTLKENANASLGKSSSEKQAIHDFMKASEILMKRNAADFGKIRELFQKYGYKPHIKDSTAEEKEEIINSDSTVPVQNKSDEEKADVPQLPTCTEKPPAPKDPLRNPQLSDFGLSQYAFSRSWSAVKGQQATNAYQENSKNRTPLKPQTPRILAKTPKCMLKMDDYECATPKLEHFGISEHTMCMNEDYTMSLIRKTAQTNKNCYFIICYLVSAVPLFNSLHVFSHTLCSAKRCEGVYIYSIPQLHHLPYTIYLQREDAQHIGGLLLSLTLDLRMCCLQKDDHEVKVPEMTPRGIMVTPGPKPIVRAEKADWMASPMVLVFCTPDVKISSRTNNTVLSRSPETNELPLPSHTETPRFPDFETRWLKTEAKVGNSKMVFLFSTAFSYQVKHREKIESVTKNDATDKQYTEDRTPFALSSDDYLKHFADPSPPKIKPYDQLLNTPPPPEITRIPDDVLQILSKYNHKVDSSKAKEMETKAGNTTRCESDFADYNKENR